MTDTLETIVARKREEVAAAKRVATLELLQGRVKQLDRARNFFGAVVDIQHPGHTRVIAEIKRCSPSAGTIREDFDPVAIAKAYEAGGAAAISCLTDEQHFGGKIEFIRLIKDAVSLPVLRKDFIIDTYQIWESRAAGADAVLLIAEILSEGLMLDMMILAQKLGMTTLVETHDVENLLKVKPHIGFPHAGYSLLGINNRDLRTMKTDLSHTIRMVELVDNTQVLVSESGIRSRQDLERLRQHGVNIVLVGEHLMRQENPEEAMRELIGMPSHN